MALIHLHPPDGSAPIQVALEEGSRLVAGREPSPEAGLAAPGSSAPLTQAVPSPQISGSHLLLWHTQGVLHARDLSSKNGTWLRLEPGADVAVPGDREAHLHLAGLRATAAAAPPEPVPVGDGDADEFAERLRQSVSAWLRRAGLTPQLRLLKSGAAPEPADEGLFTVPLAGGLLLEVDDRGAGETLAQWDRIKAQLFPYAHAQVAAFRSCSAARAGRPLAFSSRLAERALREVLEAAAARLPLVLTGETGTGKTELAAIYAGRDGGAQRRPAPEAPFVTVHCALLDPPLAHSLLFGALRGSYTSAERNVDGAVKLADGGVLFLDDVDALPLETQGKLLRFLDGGEYEPLGHGRAQPLRAQVNVVAGTNRDLRAAVRERAFREDLYWRLHSGAVVRVPPLRERPEDVEELLRRAPGTPQATAGAPSVRDRLAPAALEHLRSRHPWRGNFRECLRFCSRVRLVPAGAPLDRARCEAILAEATLDEAPSAPRVTEQGGRSTLERALEEALAAWRDAGEPPPERFEELQQFCEGYLKSVFVAHALGLQGAEERPATFDREARQRLGCDLSTLKRKVDDYLALRRAAPQRG